MENAGLLGFEGHGDLVYPNEGQKWFPYSLISQKRIIICVPRASSFEDKFILWSMVAILKINL